MWRSSKTRNEIFNLLEEKFLANKSIIFYHLNISGKSIEKDKMIGFSAIKCIIYKNCIDKTFHYVIDDSLIIKPETNNINNNMSNIIKFIKDNLLISYCNYNFDDLFLKKELDNYNCSINYSTYDMKNIIRDIITKNELDRQTLPNLAELIGINDLIDDNFIAYDFCLLKIKLFIYLLNEYLDNKSLLNDKLSTKPIAQIKNISKWNGKNYKLKRIYVETNFGSIYFDLYNFYWENKEKNKLVIERINMEKLQEEVMKLTKIDKIEDLVNYEK